MFQWNDTHVMVRDMLQSFCAEHLVPNLDALDTEQMLPYPIMRQMFDSFGMGEMSLGQFQSRLAKDKAGDEGKSNGGGGMMGMMGMLGTMGTMGTMCMMGTMGTMGTMGMNGWA